jgi:uncharacterized OB-fold protein
MCGNCQSTHPAFEWQVVSGNGRVRSWTVVRRALLPAFAQDLPYTIAEVELDDQPGLVITGQLREVAPSSITLDLRVRVGFAGSSQGFAVPHFVPATI